MDPFKKKRKTRKKHNPTKKKFKNKWKKPKESEFLINKIITISDEIDAKTTSKDFIKKKNKNCGHC